MIFTYFIIDIKTIKSILHKKNPETPQLQILLCVQKYFSYKCIHLIIISLIYYLFPNNKTKFGILLIFINYVHYNSTQF